MSATIIAFPGLAPRRGALYAAKPGPLPSQFPPPMSPSALATKFSDHFLPVVCASIDLLEANEADFEARCRSMLDAEGTAMIDELCAELQIVGQQMQILVDGLDLTRARLRTAMARFAPPPAPSYPEIPGSCCIEETN